MGDRCGKCGNEVPLERNTCPHCGGDNLFPNVRQASQTAELEALEHRYQTGRDDCRRRGCLDVLDEFESAVSNSKAVFACSLSKLIALVRQPGIFSNYYHLQRIQFHSESKPGEPNWKTLRPHAEIEFVGSHKLMDQLHYACLTLNDCGLPHYGECTILLREDMIAHRSSVFEENSAMFVQRKGVPLTKGLRSTWGDRMKLCVAKLARQIDADTNSENFPELLLKPGRQAIDDNFVEVQIFGDMTILTFERVRLASAKASTPTRMRKRTRRGSTDERAVRELCLKHHVFCDIV